MADGASHAGSSALRGRRGPPIATAQPDCARELSDQEVTLGVGLRLPHGVLERARLLDVVVDLGEAAAVGGLGALVEHRTRVPERRRLPGLTGDQVQHVDLTARVGEELCEISDALEIADANGAPVEHHQPVVALTAEDVGLGRRTRRNLDPLEDRPGRLELENGVVLAATGAESLCENHSRERRLIGRADLVPQSCGFRATPFRLRRVALREPHASASQGRPGDQRLALKSGGHPLQLVGRGTGSAEIAAGDLDLHLRIEQRRPLQGGVRWQLLRRNP